MKGCKRSSAKPFSGNDLGALLGQLAQHSSSVGGEHWFTDVEDNYNAKHVMGWLAHHAWQPEEYVRRRGCRPCSSKAAASNGKVTTTVEIEVTEAFISIIPRDELLLEGMAELPGEVLISRT